MAVGRLTSILVNRPFSSCWPGPLRNYVTPRWTILDRWPIWSKARAWRAGEDVIKTLNFVKDLLAPVRHRSGERDRVTTAVAVSRMTPQRADSEFLFL